MLMKSLDIWCIRHYKDRQCLYSNDLFDGMFRIAVTLGQFFAYNLVRFQGRFLYSTLQKKGFFVVTVLF